MNEDKRPLKVFLCHAHSDKDQVRELYLRLKKDGVDAWLDKEKLLAGADWEYEIRKAVRESDVVVVCHSTQFNQKGFRQKEVKIALEEADLLPKGEIFIIPARLEECDVLDDLKRFHWVDLFETDGYERLMRALRTRADKIGATLQVKRSFLPKLSPTQPKIGKPETSHSKLEEKREAAPQPQAGKPKPETAKLFSKFNKQTVIGLISAAVIILVVLSSKIWIKPPFVPSATTQAALDSATNQVTSTPCGTASGNWDVYVVQSGDTLFSIAVAHDVSLEELTAINCMGGNNQIQVGTQLLVPKTDSIALVPTLTATISPLPTEITDAKGVSMVLVPEGKFTMGINLYETIALCKYYYWSSEICDQKSSTYADQTPPHQVDLDAYYIDKYEVTNSQYESCVSGGVCSLPERISSGSRDIYYGNPTYGNYPVLVNWGQATTFCDWRDARLPTEAEWEKAARGIDERVFPWGDAINCENVNFSNCGGSMNTLPVGSYEKGKSPYGIYDMAGNFSELVSDWYDHDYYQQSPLDNPTGPSTGEFHIIRGGGNGNFGYILTSVYRQVGDVAGFRCAKDASAIQLIETSEIPAGGFDLISIDEVAYRGGTASAQIQTQPGTECALGFILPSGILSQAGGLGPRTADENGYCSWTWEVASNVNPGWGSIYIEAGGDSETYPIEIK